MSRRPDTSTESVAAPGQSPGRLEAALYVVATPIGNLGDLTQRAREILARVDWVIAEDTRHTRQLLTGCGIDARMSSLHEHNEQDKTAEIVQRLMQGQSIALVSDAGTPLISDPGFRLVQAAVQAGVTIRAVPGACAAIAALSIAGLPSDRFGFEGFLPTKNTARRERLAVLADFPHTSIFYEAPHRLAEVLSDMAEMFGATRPAVVARELTKTFETVYRGTLEQLADAVKTDENMRRGEIVILTAGAPEQAQNIDQELERVLRILLAEIPVGTAAKMAAKLIGVGKNEAYKKALELNDGGSEH